MGHFACPSQRPYVIRMETGAEASGRSTRERTQLPWAADPIGLCYSQITITFRDPNSPAGGRGIRDPHARRVARQTRSGGNMRTGMLARMPKSWQWYHDPATGKKRDW